MLKVPFEEFRDDVSLEKKFLLPRPLESLSFFFDPILDRNKKNAPIIAMSMGAFLSISLHWRVNKNMSLKIKIHGMSF